jgi:hypothetical protein
LLLLRGPGSAVPQTCRRSVGREIPHGTMHCVPALPPPPSSPERLASAPGARHRAQRLPSAEQPSRQHLAARAARRARSTRARTLGPLLPRGVCCVNFFSFFTFPPSILQKYMVRKKLCKTIHLASWGMAAGSYRRAPTAVSTLAVLQQRLPPWATAVGVSLFSKICIFLFKLG